MLLAFFGVVLFIKVVERLFRSLFIEKSRKGNTIDVLNIFELDVCTLIATTTLFAYFKCLKQKELRVSYKFSDNN